MEKKQEVVQEDQEKDGHEVEVESDVDPEPEEVKVAVDEETTTGDNDSSEELANKSPAEMIQLAKKRGMSRRPSHKTAGGELTEYDVIRFKSKEFQQFGVGIFLYFKFLKQLSKLFLFLFVLSIPLSLSCLSSHGTLEKTPMMFEQTTIGNLGDSETFPRIYYPSFVSMSGLETFSFIDYDEETNSLDKRDGGMVFAWSDLFGTLVFLVFLIYVKVSQKKEAQATDDANITVSDYTILVEGLPRDCYNREELQHHFQTKNNFGKVVDVAICYNDTGIIRKYLQKSTTMEKHQSALLREEKPKKIAKLEKKVAKAQKKLAKITRKYDKHCICAYVTFNMPSSVPSVLYHYPKTFLARLFMKKTLKFRNKYKIRVSRAAEPSEIIYDNMKYSKCNVRMRRTFTVVLSFVVIAVSCGMSLVAATYRANNLKSMEDEGECPEYEDPATHFLPDNAMTPLPEHYDVDCICSQLDYAQMMDHYDECKDYITETAIANVLVGGSAMIIIIINLALKFIARLLANFEKHTSLTQMERELTWKMFVGLFFNTALIILLVNASIDDFDLFFLFQGEYDDFHPEWYQIVGVSLLLTMIMNVVNPHLLPVVLHPIQKCKLWCKERKIAKSRKNSHTQRELNAMYEGKPFTLAERYAIICNTIYVSFFYSSGMPILLLMASITFFVTYYCDKFVLLKKSKTPPQYNEHIAQFAVKLIKPIVYIHLAMSIWIYGSDTVLLSHPLKAHDYGETGMGSEFEDKFLNYSAFPAFLSLVVLLTFEFVANVLRTLRLTQCAASVLKRCALCLCPCICKRCIKTDNAIHVQENIENFLDEMAKGVRFESYLPSFQDMYDMAYVNEDMRKETKGLLIKEEPLYVKQNMMANLNGVIL